ncbi:hypothetical protein LZK76_30005 (plasmid) [Rhizobium leguminosarum]|nr:hypothetical protein LZK76_30005 [Rhizobium leguminosarum]
MTRIFERADRQHAGGNTRFQLFGFTGYGHEGAGRLVARDLFRHRLDAAGRFDTIGQGSHHEMDGCSSRRQIALALTHDLV